MISIYMIRCACASTYVCTSVAGSSEARCGIPVDLTCHKERAHCGCAVISQGQRRSNNYKATIARTAGSRRAWLGRGDCGWATTELRLNNYDYHTRPGPGLRRTAVATAAEWLPVYACRARQTACWMSRQIQVNSRGDCDRAATASVRQTSVAFAIRWKQNAAERSDRQPEPLPLTPQYRGPTPLLLRVGVACETTNTLGLQTIEQDLSLYRDYLRGTLS